MKESSSAASKEAFPACPLARLPAPAPRGSGMLLQRGARSHVAVAAAALARRASCYDQEQCCCSSSYSQQPPRYAPPAQQVVRFDSRDWSLVRQKTRFPERLQARNLLLLFF